MTKQRETARQREEAQKREAIKLQAEQVLKKQQILLKSKEAPPKKDLSPGKVPPQRPRSRPQGSPSKEPFVTSLDSNKFEKSAAISQNFVADFGSNFTVEKSGPEKPSLTADLNAAFSSKQENKIKKPPPRPSAPSTGPVRPVPSSAKRDDTSKRAVEEAMNKKVFP